ncbi:hypothetical protein I302_106801 [Kwoniella bestiolae CBS 10118]|uniref:Zinc finger PHD-type domain-containing protein n=1 Tax=Kwoniella bestiolae CBS 10118 TaxID=1296100 RepID=A0A1B9G0B7_9TREE|nr:hypothetical protein I302_05933 [Kwoniella bestiolae CBS 10118]OCF24473.1 hypothetical protein I302_05933 [Kwoniella bestiolae CBS 10118]
MDNRRRTSMTSTSTIRSARESSMQVKNLRSPSVGSATPKLEDEEDGKPRRTRGRNPLPPTTGPLFPPLPPKQPKNSPKNSPQAASRSPAVRTPSGLAPPPDIIPAPPSFDLISPTAGPAPAESTELEEDAISARSVSPEKVPVQSVSNASLTPPPPTSEDTNPEAEKNENDANPQATIEGAGEGQGEGEGEDDWDSYRRHRAVRGFGNVTVKEEPGLDEHENEETPVKTRSSKINGNGSNIPASGENTPLATTPLSNAERSGSASRQTRKRRGEDELLLDDHLLPVEIRRTSFSSKKTKKERLEDDDEQDEQGKKVGEQDDADEIAVEDDEEDEEEEEEEEVKDITRCVCQKEDIDVMMIQCDECNVWQHGECMGIWGDEEAPDEYFCEECKPERHQPLMKWIRRQGRKSGSFIPPAPENLKNLHNDRDDFPPSQSKRWAEELPEEVPEPTPPPKPPSRSHHKREATSPHADTHDGRRSTRGRQPAASLTRDKPPSSSGKNDPSKSHTGKVTSSGRKVRGISSISPDRDSNSPQPSSAKEPKRRSTMNSRDAAYEEEVKAALEASRAEMMSPAHEIDETSQVEEKEKDRGEKRRREDEEEVEDKDRAKKGKRKRDEDEGSVEPGNSTKPKHPNQYTYRKPPSAIPQPPPAAPSPARRVAASTPVPIAQPAQHEHGTRRAGALAAVPVIYHPLTPESANHLSWFLPDHLSAFADLLPSANPDALEVPAPRVLSYLPRNHYHNQRYGPFSEERDENGKLVLPDEPSGREVVGDQDRTQLDPPARPRYPVKRITTAEMKKRVRNVLEYVGRVQVEEGKRQERARSLGIKLHKSHGGDVDGDGDVTMEETREPSFGEEVTGSPLPEQTKSMQLMDELTRDLINFQESFNSNGVSNGNGNGFASPIPLTTSTFSNGGINSVPPTPTLPQDTSVVPALEIPSTAIPSEETTELGSTDTEVLKQGEGLDVYRQGVVNTVVTTQAEQQVAEKVEEIVAEAERGVEI